MSGICTEPGESRISYDGGMKPSGHCTNNTLMMLIRLHNSFYVQIFLLMKYQ